MRPLFPPWTNTLIRLGLLGLAAILFGGLGLAWLYVRSPLFTQQGDPVEQPVEFDHRHHVQDDGIDCRYCHQTVEKSASAGYPSTRTCMNCHSQVWPESPLLAPVRASWFTGQAIQWQRAHGTPACTCTPWWK